MCVCVCVYVFGVGDTALSLSVFYCVDGGRTKAAMSRSLEFNDVCGKVCVFLCLCRGGGGGGGGRGGCPCSKPFEVLHIWAGYLERMLCGANAHRQREGERERRKDFYKKICFRAFFSINLSLPCANCALELYFSQAQ